MRPAGITCLWWLYGLVNNDKLKHIGRKLKLKMNIKNHIIKHFIKFKVVHQYQED